MDQRNPTPELLAPAGGADALRAAVNNGADAVYLGLRELNARRGAENFDHAGLEAACRYAHLRGARVYLTANILVADAEMEGALASIDRARSAGVDAVIVQDLGLLGVVRETLPDLRVHASTQLDAHDTSAVRALESMGAARVTLAREVSVSEIACIADQAGCEIETFIHGALCFSYSGQCLLSSVVGGRSANRGLCAQPCRLAYELLDAGGQAVATGGVHLLSPKDLAGIALLPELVRSGAAALKIEGRMKSAEYVAIVTGVYRAALDRAVADPGAYEPLPGEWEALEEAFSRGFTPGHLAGAAGDELMSRHRPNNRGVPLGRIAAVSGGRARIAFDRAADSADTIEVWTSSGRFAQRLGCLDTPEGHTTAVPAGSRAFVALEKRAAPGDRVFRVASGALLDAARRTYVAGSQRGTIPVDVGVRMRVGSPVAVALAARGAALTAEGPLVEPARTKPVTAAEVMAHVGRFGATPFVPGSWELDLDPSAGIAFSTLHAVRRDAAAGLEELLSAPPADREPLHPALPSPARGTWLPAASPEIVISAWSAEVARAALGAGADRALLREGAGEGIEPLLPRVAHDREVAAHLETACGKGRATVGHLGLLASAAAAGVACDADWPLNAFNAWSVGRLADLGARLVWLSPELSGRGVAAVAARAAVPVGVVVYGRLEVMVARECVLRAAGPCDGACAGCARRRGMWRLRDVKGYAFPVMTDVTGRAHIFNSVPLDLTRALPEILEMGIAAVRLEFSGETPERAAEVTAYFRGALEAAGSGRAMRGLDVPTTTGHFFRGVR